MRKAEAVKTARKREFRFMVFLLESQKALELECGQLGRDFGFHEVERGGTEGELRGLQVGEVFQTIVELGLNDLLLPLCELLGK